MLLNLSTDTLEDIGAFKDVEKEYLAYEKELKEFQKTLNEYEDLGLDVRDFLELKHYNPNSLKGQIDFFKKLCEKNTQFIKEFSVSYGKP